MEEVDMIRIYGPMMYQKTILHTDKTKVIHLFGDIHLPNEQCTSPSIELTTLVEKTLELSIPIDIFVEHGFGHYTPDAIPFISDASLSELANPTLLNRNYLDQFINYFTSYHGCFIRPRLSSCTNHFPKSRFHSVDMRMTLWYESMVLLQSFNPNVIKEHDSTYNVNQFILDMNVLVNRILTELQSKTLSKRNVHLYAWTRSLMDARIKRLMIQTKSGEPLYPHDLYPIAISQDDFIKDLWWLTVGIPFPAPDVYQYVGKIHPYPLYRYLHSMRHLPLELRDSVEMVLVRQWNTLFGKFRSQENLLPFMEIRYQDTSMYQDLFTFIRILRKDVGHCILYGGHQHILRFKAMMNMISSKVVWTESPIFINQKLQCISIPVSRIKGESVLSFSSDLFIDRDVIPQQVIPSMVHHTGYAYPGWDRLAPEWKHSPGTLERMHGRKRSKRSKRSKKK